MKEILYIEDTPANKISYYLLLAFLVTLPFDRIYSELSLIGLLLHTLLHPATDKKLSFRWAGWLICCLYLLMVVGALYAPRWGDAERQLEKQLAILLFPVIAWFSRLDWGRVWWRWLKGFAFSCFFTVVYLDMCALVSIHEQGLGLRAMLSPDFLNHAFTAPLDLHATYLAMYVAIALVVFIQMAVGGQRLLYGLISLILLVAVVQLASRAVCLAVLLLLNGVVPWLLLRGKARKVGLVVFLSVSLIAGTVVVVNKNLNSRYLVSLKQDVQRVRGLEEDPEPRMVRWGCAWELIRQSPWVGYGTGAEVPKLKERYYAHQLTISYTHELNAHNQYLSYCLNAGLPGGLMYAGILIVGGIIAFRRRDIFLSSFLVIVVIVSLSENILDMNKGIFFFSCFFTLFLYRYRSGVEVGQGG